MDRIERRIREAVRVLKQLWYEHQDIYLRDFTSTWVRRLRQVMW